MNTDRVGCVVKDTASSANSDGISLTSTGTAVQGSNVSAAVSSLISTTVNSNKTVFSPISGPGVADNPVAYTVL